MSVSYQLILCYQKIKMLSHSLIGSCSLFCTNRLVSAFLVPHVFIGALPFFNLRTKEFADVTSDKAEGSMNKRQKQQLLGLVKLALICMGSFLRRQEDDFMIWERTQKCAPNL